MRLVDGLQKFPSLKILKLVFIRKLTDFKLKRLHRLKELRKLIMHGRIHITNDGLVNLVRHLPHLEKLILRSRYTGWRKTLTEETYKRICEICRTRNQKMEVHNYAPDRHPNIPWKEPLVKGNEQEFLKYFFYE